MGAGPRGAGSNRDRKTAMAAARNWVMRAEAVVMVFVTGWLAAGSVHAQGPAVQPTTDDIKARIEKLDAELQALKASLPIAASPDAAKPPESREAEKPAADG